MNQGKYVFSQLFDMISRYEFDRCVSAFNGDFRVKHFSCWEQFLVMSFAQFSYRESLRDIEYCLSSVQPKLYHCGIKTKVAKTTLAKANETRPWNIYEMLAKLLMQQAIPLYKGDNQLAKELQSCIYAFDSTTIRLCMGLFPWARFGTRRNGIKVHVLVNVEGYIPEFVHITNSNKQDSLIMDELSYRAGCFYVMDKGYVDYKRLYKIELSKAIFVTRAKSNMSYDVIEKSAVNKESGVLKDELVNLKRWHTQRWYPDSIRRIEYKDEETGLFLVFLTNDLLIDAAIVAALYKERWKVELFFKWIKQNLRIKKFYGTSQNAVRVQIWIAICNYLQAAILKKRMNIQLPLSQVLQVLSVSLFDKIDIHQLFNPKPTKFISKMPTLF